MSSAKPHDTTWVWADYELPAHITRDIGRIIVRWAHFEYRIQRVVWSLVDINEKFGRIAVRDPRVSDRLEMIEQLAEVRKIQLPDPLFSDIKKAVAEPNRWRDLLAHGVWGRHFGDWKVQLTKGKYMQNDPPHSKNKKIDPEGVYFSQADFQSLTNKIEKLIKQGELLHKIVDVKMLAWRQTPPSQSAQASSRNSKKGTPKPPRRSSRG